jgi:hypothetical protein
VADLEQHSVPNYSEDQIVSLVQLWSLSWCTTVKLGERRVCEPIVPSGGPSEAEEAEMVGTCAEGWGREFGKCSCGP